MQTKTITKIPAKPRKPAQGVQAENYALHSLKEAWEYTRMAETLFKEMSLLHNCLPIKMGNRYYYKLSALNKLIDSMDTLNN